MSESCSGNCGGCSSNCSSRDPQSLILPQNKDSNIKKKIAVVSGKGGVGKSMVTSMMAVCSQRLGYKTAIMDADITGPSIPHSFGIHSQIVTNDDKLYPLESRNGIKIMSTNLLVDDESSPVVWRGALISSMVKQFWTDIAWGDVDYMFIDMPPGTGDVPLTVFQSIDIDGIIIVSTPQQLVGMIVEKAVNMAKMTNVEILGLVENMSYIKCPHCNEVIYAFGESHIDLIAEKHGIKNVFKLPMDSTLTSACDNGIIEMSVPDSMDEVFKKIFN